MAEIDKLEIVIKADSSSAVTEIDRLSTSLTNLKKNAKLTTAVNNLNKLSTTVDKFKTNESFGKLDDVLKNINNSVKELSKNLPNITKSLNRVKVPNVASSGLFQSGKNNKAGSSFLDSLTKNLSVIAVGTYIGKAIDSINEYIEAANLFTVSMGEFYDEASKWADLVSEKLGIDPAEFMKNQGTFMAMAKGMGIANQQAYQLSKGLTEMAYDLSSFTNIPIEEAFTKLRSALAGEIEPLRQVGISVTQAALQEKALALGIEEKVNAMTDAEKSILRYQVILDSMRNMGAIGDFAKTLESPANAIRVLKMQLVLLTRSIGSLFIPILTQVLPYLQAFVNVLTSIIRRLAALVGFEMPKWDASSWNNASDSSGVVADNMDEASNSAKKMKDYLMGFDELNIINPDTNSAGSGDVGGASGGIGGMDLEEVWNTALLDEINTKAKKIEETFKRILPIVGAIGVAFGAWQLVKSISKLTKLIDMAKLGLGIAGGSKSAALGGDLLMGSKFTDSFLKLGKILGKTSIGSMIMGSGTASITATATALAAVTASVLALGIGFIDVVKKSENFRNGVLAIGDAISWLVQTVFKGGKWVIGSFSEALSGLIPKGLINLIDGLDLSMGDLLITIGGLALFGPVGLAIEGAVLAIKAIGYAAGDSIQPVDLFGEGISDITKEKVAPFIEKMNDLENSLNILDWGNAIVTASDIKDIESKLQDVVNIILKELDSDKNEALQNISPLKNVLTNDEFSEIEKSIEESYSEQARIVKDGQDRINEILASSKGGKITREQADEINKIREEMKNTGIKYLSESETESNLIYKRLKDSSVQINAEQCSQIIKQAITARDETIKAAQDEYEGILLETQRLYDAGYINDEQYNRIIGAAETSRDETIQAANDQYNNIVATAKRKMGELANRIDYTTGEIKSRWAIWCDNIGRYFSEMWDDIKTYARTKWNDLKIWFNTNIAPVFTKQFWLNKWDSIKTSFSTTMDNLKTTISRKLGEIKELFSFSWSLPRLSVPKVTIEDYGQIPWGLGGFGRMPRLGVQWQQFAQGGFIEDGLFTMNKGEIAGKFDNGKSVVANNEQIISGISQGVYEAFTRAFSDSNGSQSVNVNVYLDGQQISRSIKKSDNDKGLSLFGNELNYGL